jgi:dihydrolipoamide dehydrogenase
LKTAIVERESLGGICLNWGCIPAKALMKSAEVFEYLMHAQNYGAKVSGVEADFEAIIKRSRGVANKMSKGVQFLMKKNKIDVIKGVGRLNASKALEVTDADGKTTTYQSKNIVLATGARSRELPSLPIDGKKIIGYRKQWYCRSSPNPLSLWERRNRR